MKPTLQNNDRWRSRANDLIDNNREYFETMRGYLDAHSPDYDGWYEDIARRFYMLALQDIIDGKVKVPKWITS